MFIKGLALGDWIINNNNQFALFIESLPTKGAIGKGLYELCPGSWFTLWEHEGWRELTHNEKQSLKARLKRMRNFRPDDPSAYETDSIGGFKRQEDVRKTRTD